MLFRAYYFYMQRRDCIAIRRRDCIVCKGNVLGDIITSVYIEIQEEVMVSFASDYIAGAHPEILKRLTETNMEALTGYGTDEHCDHAKELIRQAVGMPDADVEFIAGGTQTNMMVISTMLNDWEGVLAADTGHIATHEAGAIEYSSHKVIGLPQEKGKIKASSVEEYIAGFYADENHEHEVFPGMVYISYPTEYGTLYTKEELAEIHSVCMKHNIPLYIDGARLAYGLASRACDLTLPEFASLCDVFYIGGTKCGALCGEAIVFTNHNRPAHFMNAVKKRGALLAKGRLLGVQFETLFSSSNSASNQGQAPTGAAETLYMEIGRHGIEMAERLEKILRDKGYEFFLKTPTNQKFIVVENDKLEEIRCSIDYGFWEMKDDTHTVIRLATSWSTTEEDLKVLGEVL